MGGQYFNPKKTRKRHRRIITTTSEFMQSVESLQLAIQTISAPDYQSVVVQKLESDRDATLHALGVIKAYVDKKVYQTIKQLVRGLRATADARVSVQITTDLLGYTDTIYDALDAVHALIDQTTN